MKIAQYVMGEKIRLGIIENDKLIPIRFDGDMVDFMKAGKPAETAGDPLPLDEVKLAAPVTRPSKIIAIGLNYRDHAEENKMEIPENPIVFAKFPSSLLEPNGTITWSEAVTQRVDYEAEMAVIIGKKVYACTEANANQAVFGYSCANDVSARDHQREDGQWIRGKSLDTFCPLGPWIVTADEIADPHSLGIQCIVNDEVMQSSNTNQLIFGIPNLISFLSRHFTLLPGDIILTGTAGGVGVFRKPPVFLKDGDEVIVEIEGLGRLVNRCKVISS